MTESLICAVDGCCKKVVLQGWCKAHYSRFAKHGSPTGGRIPQGAAMAHFKDVVLKHQGSDDCLIWPFGRDSVGYGRLWTGTKAENVCRMVCEDREGPPPRGFYAAHSCGMGRFGCVNPQHLRWASPKENSQEHFHHKANGMGRYARPELARTLQA